MLKLIEGIPRECMLIVDISVDHPPGVGCPNCRFEQTCFSAGSRLEAECFYHEPLSAEVDDSGTNNSFGYGLQKVGSGAYVHKFVSLFGVSLAVLGRRLGFRSSFYWIDFALDLLFPWFMFIAGYLLCVLVVVDSTGASGFFAR